MDMNNLRPIISSDDPQIRLRMCELITHVGELIEDTALDVIESKGLGDSPFTQDSIASTLLSLLGQFIEHTEHPSQLTSDYAADMFSVEKSDDGVLRASEISMERWAEINDDKVEDAAEEIKDILQYYPDLFEAVKAHGCRVSAHLSPEHYKRLIRLTNQIYQNNFAIWQKALDFIVPF